MNLDNQILPGYLLEKLAQSMDGHMDDYIFLLILGP